jgi:hypothetical protein
MKSLGIKTISRALKLQIWVFSFGLFVFLFLSLTVREALAATNISSTDKWAWNDVVGWLNFYSTNSVNVKDDKIEGYAVFENSPGNYLSLDCATGPEGSNCSVNYFVANDGNGSLAGWAWSDVYGWVSFCGNSTQGSVWNGSTWVCPPNPTYQTTIEPSGANAGDFKGWAWNDLIGWISFNCSTLNPPDCSPSYKVNTLWRNGPTVSGWLISSTFDTKQINGAAFNSIMWRGDLGTGQNAVKFQLATSNEPAGEWSYLGPDGTSASFYVPAGPGVPVPVVTAHHNNKRYYRYKVYLEFKEKFAGSTPPVVEEIIVNWSP